MRTHDIAIVGAGPAGCAAAVQCRRLGKRAFLVDRAGRVGGLAVGAYAIENYPGLGPTGGPEFSALLGEHIARFGVELVAGEVESIRVEGGGFTLAVAPLGEVRAGAVIVATGTAPRKLDIPGASDLEGSGLFYEVTEALARSPLERALIIGGGEAALDYSLSLARAGTRVTVCVRSGALRARGRLVELVGRNPDVELRFDAAPVSLARSGDGVTIELETREGVVAEGADIAVAALGRYSRGPELLKELDLPPPEALSAGLPGLFVAGDVRRGSLGQAGMAVGDGLAAAMAAVAHLEEGEARR